MSFFAYRTLQSSSAVQDGVYANFTSSGSENLLVTKQNSLEIYSVTGNGEFFSLTLVCVHKVFGEIQSIGTFRFNGRDTDAVLLSFGEAKLAVIEFDPVKNEVVTTGMYFMDHKRNVSKDFDQVSVTKIVVDPAFRCFVTLVFDHHLMVFPASLYAHKTTVSLFPAVTNSTSEFTTDIVEIQSHTQIGKPYLVNLDALGIKNIKDCNFLEGYLDPSLLILHEPNPIWSGRFALSNVSCQLAVVALSSQDFGSHVISRGELLPHELISIVPVPLPVGGALVLGANTILYFQQSIVAGLSLNEFGDAFGKTWPLVKTKNKGCIMFPFCSFITDKDLLISSRGRLWVLRLFTHADGPALRAMDLFDAGYSPHVSVIITRPNSRSKSNSWMFFGSNISDSMLVGYERVGTLGNESRLRAIVSNKVSLEAESNRDGSTAAKRTFSELENDSKDENMDFVDTNTNVDDPNLDVEKELYDPAFALFGVLPGFEYDPLRIVHFPECPFKFIVLDMIATSANFRNTLSISSQPAESKVSTENYIDIVTTTGVGATGGLRIFQEGIRPDPVALLNLVSGVSGAWSLIVEDEAMLDISGHYYHSLMLTTSIVQQKSTLFSIKSTIEELDSDFLLSTSTLVAGNILNNAYIVQVHRYGVIFLKYTTRVEEITMEEIFASSDYMINLIDPHIVSATIRDPVILLQLSDKSIRVFVPRENNLSNQLQGGLLNGAFLEKFASCRNIECCSLFADINTSPWFGSFIVTKGDSRFVEGKKSFEASQNDELEEKMLYENSVPLSSLPSFDTEISYVNDDQINDALFGYARDVIPIPEVKEVEMDNVFEEKYISTVSGKIFVLAVVRGHNLEFYRLDISACQMECIFQASKISFGAQTLFNRLGTPAIDVESSLCVVDVCLHVANNSFLEPSFLKDELSVPFLFLSLTNGDVLVYKAYRCPPLSQLGSGNLANANCALAFSRVVFPFISRLPHKNLFSSSSDSFDSVDELLLDGSRENTRTFYPFSDIAGRSGVFISGWRPMWLFIEKGSIWNHGFVVPLHSSVVAITEFHTQICPRGFAFFNENDVLNISQLPGLDSACLFSFAPFRTILIGKTTHSIASHPDSRSLMLAVSQPTSTLSLNDVTNRSLPVFAKKYKLLLVTVTAKGWHLDAQYDKFDEAECIECLYGINLKKFVKGSNQPANLQSDSFVAVGTRTSVTEDLACGGRIIFFQVYNASIVQAEGTNISGETENTSEKRLQLRYEHKEKRPILAFDSIEGMLALAIGQRVFLYRWVDDELSAYAFLDAQYHITSIKCLKRYLVIGDIQKSISLYHWEPIQKQLHPLGKDQNMQKVISCGFIIDNNELHVLSTDFLKNFQLYCFAPQKAESQGGKYLVTRADFHTGAFINSILSFRMRRFILPSNTSNSLTDRILTREEVQSLVPMEHKLNRYMSLGSDWQGGFHEILPIDELVYRRLFSLHTQLTLHLRHLAGLNPRAYRNMLSNGHVSFVPKRNVVDLDLILLFNGLDREQQDKIAQTIGTTSKQIIENLLDIELSTRLF